MTDTQWPQFYVFKQDRPDEPHLNCGALHAPDVEMALLSARDVFVRRPECVSLWVVPADAVASVTRDGLAALAVDTTEDPRSPVTFEVFSKPARKGQHAHVGQVEATTAREALERAAHQFDDDVWVWWVVPTSEIMVSREEDAPAWFEPARDKLYRDQSFYKTEGLIRRIRAASERDTSQP